ncbi:MAG: 4-hydroxy-3-methylbut-2-enyl diphosphate reductase [Deltaproteobacteria bacterium]|nr:4-hydroxy-3-methylbut-2-enyl diphosphate reductase [Deltaproteobacteria bacterium]
MKVIVAKSAGFCFGVKRATTMALGAASGNGRIYSLGPIIHSPQMVAKLEEKGVRVIDRVDQAGEQGAVIVRSHGVTVGEMERIADRGLGIIDATCPFVKKAQKYAELLDAEGYTLVLVGEREHPEVKGIVSYARRGQVHVVADPEEARKIPAAERIGMVAQTTQSYENLQRIAAICLDKCAELRVFKTICDATAVRQNEAREIAGKVDVMLVIGGYNSANTTRLATICRDIAPRTHHIETAAQIDRHWFTGAETVGVTAGASTPHWIIEEVLQKVASIDLYDGK